MDSLQSPMSSFTHPVPQLHQQVSEPPWEVDSRSYSDSAAPVPRDQASNHSKTSVPLPQTGWLR